MEVLLDGGEESLPVAQLVKAAPQQLSCLAERGARAKIGAPQELVGMRAQIPRLVPLCCRGNVVEAFGAQEVGTPGPFGRTLQAGGLVQRAVRIVGGKAKVAAATVKKVTLEVRSSGRLASAGMERTKLSRGTTLQSTKT